MAIGGGLGGNQAKIDIQTLGRGFSAVTRHDIVVAHSPVSFTLGTGFVAGVLVWLIPVVLLGLNSLITWFSSGAPADLTTLTRTLPLFLPYVAATGALGIIFAALRRLSATTKRYVTVGNITVGFNSAFATLGGVLIAAGFAVSGSAAGIAVWLLGIGAPLMGFLVDGLWEVSHNALLRVFGRPDMDALLSIEVENFLARHPGLGHFVLKDVSVVDGTAVVRGEWANKETRDRVQYALRCIDGVDRVRIERAG